MILPLSSRKPLFLYIVFFVSYYLFGFFLSSISFQSQIVPIWLPAGIALVGCYLWWWKFLPAVFIASFCFNYSVHQGIILTDLFAAPGAEITLIACGVTLQAFIGSFLLRYWLGNPLKQISSIKTIYFVFIVGLMVNLISANIGVFALSTFNADYLQENYWRNVVNWWLGDSLGVILLAPFFTQFTQF